MKCTISPLLRRGDIHLRQVDNDQLSFTEPGSHERSELIRGYRGGIRMSAAGHEPEPIALRMHGREQAGLPGRRALIIQPMNEKHRRGSIANGAERRLSGARTE